MRQTKALLSNAPDGLQQREVPRALLLAGIQAGLRSLQLSLWARLLGLVAISALSSPEANPG